MPEPTVINRLRVDKDLEVKGTSNIGGGGGEGEGSNETISPDMTASEVQSTIDSLSSEGGGTIVWEPGTHTYTQNTTVGGEPAAIELKSDIRYFGHGYATRIQQGEVDINVLATDYDSSDPERTSAGNVENIEVAHMRLDGNKSAFSGFSTRQQNNVLWTPLVRDSHIHHIWADNVHQHGIHPDAVIRTTVSNCVIRGPDGQGVHMATRNIGDGNVAGPLDSRISDTVVINSGSVGLSADAGDDGKNVVISRSTVVGSGGSGISIDVTGGTVSDCYVRGSTSEGYKLDGNGTREQTSIYNSVAEGVTGSGNVGARCLAANMAIEGLTTIAVERGIHVNDSGANLTASNCNLNATGRGFFFQAAESASLSDSKIRNSTNPLYIGEVPDVRIRNVITENGEGSTLDSDNAVIDGLTIISSEGWHALRCQGTGMTLKGVRGRSNGSVNNLINLEGPDGSVSDATSDGTESNLVNTPSVRPRWEGIIGGGPIGGVDIGSTTGATAGDLARSNGTTGTTDEIFILKASGDWQSLADPTSTVTPA